LKRERDRENEMMMKPSGENVQLLRTKEKKVSLMKMCEQLSSMNTKDLKKEN